MTGVKLVLHAPPSWQREIVNAGELLYQRSRRVQRDDQVNHSIAGVVVSRLSNHVQIGVDSDGLPPRHLQQPTVDLLNWSPDELESGVAQQSESGAQRGAEVGEAGRGVVDLSAVMNHRCDADSTMIQ